MTEGDVARLIRRTKAAPKRKAARTRTTPGEVEILSRRAEVHEQRAARLLELGHVVRAAEELRRAEELEARAAKIKSGNH